MFSGCLAYNTPAVTAQNLTAGATLAFNSEVYDVGFWHTNTSRITVPAGVDYAAFLANVIIDNFTVNNGLLVEIRKNGAGLSQNIFTNTTVNNTSAKIQIWSGPLAVAAGDYFEVFVTCAVDTSVDISASSWFAGWKCPAAPNTFSGCVAKRVASLSAADFTTAIAVALDDELYDVGGWHDTVTNNSRLTVPAGVSYVQLVGGIDPSALTATQWGEVSIRKNGSALAQPIVVNKSQVTATVARWQIMTPPLAVTPGDYFELFFQTQSDASITLLDTRLWLAAWKVD